MPDYSKGCIYKIKHKEDYDDENIYVGSTCNIIRRRCKHKNTCNNPEKEGHNRLVYQHIRINGGWDDFILIKIHDYPCKDKDELKIEERRMVDILKSKLNMISPYLTDEEYIEKDKDRCKKYRENNKEKIAEKKREEYLNNKEKIIERSRIRYENNKEERKEKITCECGSVVSKASMTRHCKTKTHQQWIKNKNLNIN